MSNKAFSGYDAASAINATGDFLLISPSNNDAYNRISRNVLLGITSQPLGLTDVQSPTNKTFDNTTSLTIKDGSLTLQNSSSVTKQATFSLAGVTAGQTRVITLPDSNTTLPIASQIVTISGPTNARTYTFPDAATTIVGTSTTQTLTNKTLTSSTNTLGGVTLGLGSDTTGDIFYNASGVLTRLGIGTAGQVLAVNGGATAPSWASSASQVTLLKANSGTDTNAGATNVDTFALSGLTAKDTIVIEYSVNSLSNTTAAGSIYSSTDSASLIATSALTSGTGEMATVKIRQSQNSNTVYMTSIANLGAVTLGSGGTATSSAVSYQALTTSFQGSWTIALRHGGVTAGGTYRWSWAVFKLAGQ